jgi:DNA-binding NtrC family response regulator
MHNSPKPAQASIEVKVMPAFEYPIVLVVDDEPHIRDLVHVILQRDYSVLLAEDGVRAVEIAQQFTGEIHLLVSDVRMPRMGGVEAARRILAERPATRVLLMSGEGASSLPAEDRRYSFVAKPFTASAFRSAVNGALGGETLPVCRTLQRCAAQGG